MRKLILSIILFYLQGPVHAEPLRVAVASNFADTLMVLAKEFEEETDVQMLISTGSSGKLFAQISNGAPFDLFFSADSKRAKKLEDEGRAKKASRFTYARGILVLWALDKTEELGPKVLTETNFRYLAIANPRHAPYGRAAKEVLKSFGLWQKVQKKLVRAENVTQAYQYVYSGNAQMGLVALAQLKRAGVKEGSYWLLPQERYQPIEQQAVILTNHPQAKAFVNWLKSEPVRALIKSHGYQDAG